MIPLFHRQHKIQIALVVVILALFPSACCPYPHYEREAPVFEGTITRQGKTAANVRVTLSTQIMNPPGCANPKVETRTDANGKFHLDPPKYFSPSVAFGDRRDGWSLCFQFADGLEAVWDDSGYYGGPSLQILECEIGDVGSQTTTLRLRNIGGSQNLSDGCRVETVSGNARTKTAEAPSTPQK